MLRPLQNKSMLHSREGSHRQSSCALDYFDWKAELAGDLRSWKRTFLQQRQSIDSWLEWQMEELRKENEEIERDDCNARRTLNLGQEESIHEKYSNAVQRWEASVRAKHWEFEELREHFEKQDKEIENSEEITKQRKLEEERRHPHNMTDEELAAMLD